MDTDAFHDLRTAEIKDQLRFITCGSVDDGKSTLIGRLLHDSKGVPGSYPVDSSGDGTDFPGLSSK